jgi:hypothetical protein
LAGKRPEAARAAFLATMAWGYGRVGYGPDRARRILESTAAADDRLMQVAQTLALDGPVAAYTELGGRCRLVGFGPAFGTKFLAFCQPASRTLTALIHDNLVSAWLDLHGRPDLVSKGWETVTYAAYLEQMHLWAAELRSDPEDVEYLIFQSMANEVGGQWAVG